MKILILFIILIPSISYAEIGSYRACSGSQCRAFDAEFYSAAEIKTNRPAKFCFTYMRSYRTYSDGNRILMPAYLLEDDCKRLSNMPQSAVWDYRNPVVQG